MPDTKAEAYRILDEAYDRCHDENLFDTYPFPVDINRRRLERTRRQLSFTGILTDVVMEVLRLVPTPNTTDIDKIYNLKDDAINCPNCGTKV